jgi:hypothetical protein
VGAGDIGEDALRKTINALKGPNKFIPCYFAKKSSFYVVGSTYTKNLKRKQSYNMFS